MATTDTKNPKKSKKGFAAMTVERRKRIAELGGKRAHQLGKAHEWTKEEAVKAGRLGGKRRHMPTS